MTPNAGVSSTPIPTARHVKRADASRFRHPERMIREAEIADTLGCFYGQIVAS